MFRLVNNGSLPLMFKETPIWESLRVVVKVDTGEQLPLEQVNEHISEGLDDHGPYKLFEYRYKKDEIASFTLSFYVYEWSIKAYGEVELHCERLFAKNPSLTPEGGVTIKLDHWTEPEGLVAHYLHKDWWTRPHFQKDIRNLPPRTQSLLWKVEEDYLGWLPLPDDVVKSEIQGTEDGCEITVSSYENGRDYGKFPMFMLGVKDNPFTLTEQMTSAIARKGRSFKTISERTYPSQLDYFGWCSWDAFYKEVHADGVLKKAEELKDKKIPAKWMLIDDGWSEVKEERLAAFSADPEKFPGGLKEVVSCLKQDFGVHSVGVWHTLAGYWGGIDPDSELAKDMSQTLYETRSRKLIPYPDKQRGFGFWDAWHNYLKAQGIDFVKVDAQSGINNFMRYHMPIGLSSQETHKALEASTGIHFNHTVINCMGMAQENVWNRPISSISRSSDDFVPDDPAGFSEHALQNTYNSLWHGELYYGDWDMFWTQHKDAKRHALLRAVSGGPIYTSDPVGKTDPDLIWPLIYRDGKIIRCDSPGKPTQDTLMSSPVGENTLLKVQNNVGEVGILTLFHVNKDAEMLNDVISPSIIDLCNSGFYWVFDYNRRNVFEMKNSDEKEITLHQEEADLYFFLPHQTITPIGLIDKYISPATFEELYRNEKHLTVRVKEGGRVWVYC
ncbi:Raffinose synthase or seed imbibition protein Sip1 [Halobacillus dabanensis]|uniref:Raffinose synthase or seed imbibition protein Sip1 n=1 Tax=Halobacillus dabanensis TaxID=240302 RepID=A0A1I3RWI2_HALDA|nr:Sip1-related alpha-galactosidase [Halobacillus dabanensis]SFJ50944.1 Raffinose synthase or seed imbibition protein Sip1 [Halobacillus dabanensis]